MKRIVIIGGGFCGTVTAINLARLSSIPLHISIIDKNPLPCRGIAYGTRNSSHLLNVVARNMSALADQPHHFVEWLGTRSDYLEEPLAALRTKFVPRKVYGDYLHNLFQWHTTALGSEKGIRFESIRDEASDLTVDHHQATVVLASGESLIADKVILAVGNQAPGPFALPGLDVKSPKYIGNPWVGWEARLPSSDQDILLIGTGLTMVDTFLSLQDRGWRGKMIAVSRNGLLPYSHFKGCDYPDFLAEKDITLGLRKLFSIFKNHYRRVLAAQMNPAILVDKLRPLTQRIWQNLSVFEKRQFNRHLRTRWNVLRHRLAPEIHRQVLEAIEQGRLEIVKGRLSKAHETEDKLTVEIKTRREIRKIEVGVLINCAGPQESYFPSESRLFNNLIAHGLVQPDEIKMGIKGATNFSVMDAAGRESEVLLALGTLLKGTLWETTAVPELRSQAFRVAETVIGQLTEIRSGKSSITEVVEDVLEYCI